MPPLILHYSLKQALQLKRSEKQKRKRKGKARKRRTEKKAEQVWKHKS
jgi:hypothetical protein